MKEDFNTAFSRKKPLKAPKSAKAPAQTSKKPEGGGGSQKTRERGVDAAIRETWALIDKAKARLNAASVSEREKISWAGVLANTIGTLNRLLDKTEKGKIGEEDLASILSKVPEKYVKIVRRGLKAVKAPDFEGIGRGDLVELVWLDASMSRSVVKLSNRVVATYKRTVGRFLAVTKDARYGVGHVIISTETTDNAVYDITSIPLPIVVDIRKLAPKDAKKAAKNGANVMWTSPLSGGGHKIVMRKRQK